MAFDDSWASSRLSSQIIPLQARIQTIRYWNPSCREDDTFVNCLAPGNDHPIAVRERFYYHLDRTLRAIPARSVRTLCGDFNPHVGPELSLPHIQGHGYDW